MCDLATYLLHSTHERADRLHSRRNSGSFQGPDGGRPLKDLQRTVFHLTRDSRTDSPNLEPAAEPKFRKFTNAAEQ